MAMQTGGLVVCAVLCLWVGCAHSAALGANNPAMELLNTNLAKTMAVHIRQLRSTRDLTTDTCVMELATSDPAFITCFTELASMSEDIDALSRGNYNGNLVGLLNTINRTMCSPNACAPRYINACPALMAEMPPNFDQQLTNMCSVLG